MECLNYPFDSKYILKNKKSIKRELLKKDGLITKNVAILGGSTTSEIKNILELFLLNNGIKPVFYESEYNQYYSDIMFKNEKLDNFKPDIIYIHTSNRNIANYPSITDSKEEVSEKIDFEVKKFYDLWDKIFLKYNCPIIQNNMEMPFYRCLGNRDVFDIHGYVNYINIINSKFYEYANNHNNFYINDINYLSSFYGLNKWADQAYWYMYKYALNVNAIPFLAFSVANIIKSIYGKNKKAIVLDLDNTLWGGVIGDDGQENIIIGPEFSCGEAYLEFQKYLKMLKDRGVILNIDSKNDYDNAILGLEHPSGVLKKDDFVLIKANWEPKSKNIKNIANELSLGLDSFVFIDDNPAERAIINKEAPMVETLKLDNVEDYIKILDFSGFFEVTNISSEDLSKTQMYKSNIKRNGLLELSENYGDYLKSLKMKAVVSPFDNAHVARIAQLSNKSNQFNLTTHRYNDKEIEAIKNDNNYITLYGTLSDCFGDNGLITAVIGHVIKDELHIDLWIMSCRVLKRDMELLMLDKIVEQCQQRKIKKIIGYYYPTKKNHMVENFYFDLGFVLINKDSNNNTSWKLELNNYKSKNKFIEVIK